MHKFKKAFTIFSLILALVIQSSFMFFSPVQAKADDLVIEDNGSIVLVITDGSAVLAAESGKKIETHTGSTSNQTKVVIPPKSESTVKIDPKPSSDNKVKITVQTPAAPSTKLSPSTTNTTQNAPQGPATQVGSTTSSAPAVSATPQTTVDKVILNGADQKPIITISGDKSKDLSIQNGAANLSTSLPVQVDNSVSSDGTVKHDLSVTTASGPVKLSVLPDIAVKAAQSEAANPNLQTTKTDVALTTVNTGLVNNKQDPTYTVKEEKKGKILGIIPVTLNSEVQISATSGKTTSTWQSPLSIFGFLVK